MAQEIDWEVVYKILLPKIFRYFSYRIGNRKIAEDLTSLTFEKAWRGRKWYRRDVGKFSNWVFGIAHKVSIDHFRKTSSHQEISIEENKAISVNPYLEENLQKKTDFKQLTNLIHALPEREQELISLKYGADLNNREIAKLTGLSESNVGTVLHRSVKKLRSEWEKTDE